jgi:hypothetical protein
MPRVSRREFEQLPLRVHITLAGIPLYDVWAIDLAHWHAGITLDQFLKASPMDSIPISPLARFLFRLRFSIGKVLGWDKTTGRRGRAVPDLPSNLVAESTFVSRVSAADYKRSLIQPGTPEKAFSVVYSFANEHVVELKNKTVHGALALALEEKGLSYRLYLGVFVLSVSRLTPYYMAVIAPFRHWIVYPSLLRGFRERWNETFGSGTQQARILD